MPNGDDRVGRRPVAGTARDSSVLGLYLGGPLGPGPSGLDQMVGLLRAARRRGISSFDLGSGPAAAAAERAISRAFPESDREILVLGRRSLHSLSGESRSGPGGSNPRELAGRLRDSILESSTRLRPHRVDLVRWSDAGAPRETSELARSALRELAADRVISGWVEELDGATRSSGSIDGEAATTPLVAGRLSLLETRLVPLMEERSHRAPVGFFADDPLAGGRLDGSRFRPDPLGAGPGVAPVRLSELEREARPVLSLAFLTTGTDRTLAQAAVQFATRWPWVAAVLLPLPSPERLAELVGSGSVSPLDDAEVERIVGAATD